MQREILRKRILLCLICIAAWAIPLRANEVIATGAAEIFNDNTSNANSQALQNALRRAVERTVGDLIDSETLSRNFQIIKDEIFNSSRSLITRYEILEEGPTEDKRAYQVEIRAWIAGKKIRDKLKALRILRNKTGSKRMMVIYRKQDPLALSRQFQTIPAQLGILNGIFRQAGFQLLDESEMNRVYQVIEGAGVINRPTESLIFLALDQRAEILVVIEMLSSQQGVEGGSFNTIQADVHLSVYDVSTGRLIAEVLGSGTILSTGRQGVDEHRILEEIGATAVRNAAKEALDEIRNYYQSSGDQGFLYLTEFRNYNPDEVDKILDYLESVAAFKDLSELKNTPNHLEIEMISSESKSRLRRKIQWELQQKNIPMNSRELSGNRLIFIKPGTASD